MSRFHSLNVSSARAAAAMLPTTGVAAGILLALGSAVLGASLSSIRVTAERTVLRADGLSTTVISALVYDDRGNLVPDGTRVRFSLTGGGRLDTNTAVTQSGTARATLTAPDQPGTTLVVVALDTPGATVPQNITITFSRDADSADTGIAWGRIEGPYVAYAQIEQVLQANGNKRGPARFSYRGLTVTAQVLQINVTQNVLVARGNVVLSKNGVTHDYLNLRYAFLQGEGAGERLLGQHLQSVDVRGANLTETPPPIGAPPPGP